MHYYSSSVFNANRIEPNPIQLARKPINFLIYPVYLRRARLIVY